MRAEKPAADMRARQWRRLTFEYLVDDATDGVDRDSEADADIASLRPRGRVDCSVDPNEATS